MSLSDRIRQREAWAPIITDISEETAPPEPPPAPSIRTRLPPPEERLIVDPFAAVKQRTSEALFARLGMRLFDSSLDKEHLRSYVVQEIGSLMAEEVAPLSASERQRLVAEITDDVLGLGPIERFLADDTVTEIMVNAANPIYIERDGRLERTESRFVSHDHLRRVIERIVSQVGRRIDESSPMVDARLPDGSRVNAIIPPLAVDGPVLTIRKFARTPYQVSDLITFGTMSTDAATLLAACVTGRLNVLVTGGTGTGKTTMLNVLSSFIPENERVVTIEDAVELQLHQHHVVRLECRPTNIEGKGDISVRDLVRNALRMRPDRIIVGEVRGGEALDMLQAMNTGHEGSLSTVHANSPRDALARLETMVLMAGIDLPTRAIREQIASAIDLIVHVSRLRDGTRRVTDITEVDGMEGDVITLQDLYRFNYGAGIDQYGRFLGHAIPTGLRPHFSDRLADVGVQLTAGLFGTVNALAEQRGPR